MKSLEMFLAQQYWGESQSSKFKNLNIFTDDIGKIWLYFEIQEKENNEEKIIKRVKKNITNLFGKFEETYYNYVATEMLRQNYLLIAIEGGWLVHGGEEPYQLNKEACSCMASLNNPSTPCNHLIFLQWHLSYRSKCNQVKQMYIN